MLEYSPPWIPPEEGIYELIAGSRGVSKVCRDINAEEYKAIFITLICKLIFKWNAGINNAIFKYITALSGCDNLNEWDFKTYYGKD